MSIHRNLRNSVQSTVNTCYYSNEATIYLPNFPIKQDIYYAIFINFFHILSVAIITSIGILDNLTCSSLSSPDKDSQPNKEQTTQSNQHIRPKWGFHCLMTHSSEVQFLVDLE
jgi:hypothetical protein